MNGLVIGLIVVGVIALVVILWAVGVYNKLVRIRQHLKDSWSGVDVELKRRYDLIPNLVETVKGYASHEAETLEAVIAARQGGVDADGPAAQAEAENVITGALGRLFALSEAYPDLKADSSFLNLQEELSGIEGKIAYARQYYNDSVTRYHNAIESFPSNLIAGGFGFTKREYFETDGEARGPVEVQF